MIEVLLFHHALGLTAGVRACADELREVGCAVVTPDLYDGKTFDSLEDGVLYAEGIGMEVLAERGASHASELGDQIVVVGLSLGVLPAQKLAQTRSEVVGAVLCHSVVPLSACSRRIAFVKMGAEATIAHSRPRPNRCPSFGRQVSITATTGGNECLRVQV